MKNLPKRSFSRLEPPEVALIIYLKSSCRPSLQKDPDFSGLFCKFLKPICTV